jgi:PBP1b-binding outer membrane lipoprotein LpoB
MSKTIALMIIMTVLFTGCATNVAPDNAMSKDKRIHIRTAVSDPGLTGMTTTANIVTFMVTNPVTKRLEEKENVYVTHSAPLGRELLTTAVGAVTPALIYRNAIMNAGCKSNCSTVTAIAGSQSSSSVVGSFAK